MTRTTIIISATLLVAGCSDEMRSGQISLRGSDGDAWDISKCVGMKLYTKEPK